MRFILGRRIEQSARRLNDARWARPIDSKANMKRRRTWCHGLREVKRIRKVKKEKKKKNFNYVESTSGLVVFMHSC